MVIEYSGYVPCFVSMMCKRTESHKSI